MQKWRLSFTFGFLLIFIVGVYTVRVCLSVCVSMWRSVWCVCTANCLPLALETRQFVALNVAIVYSMAPFFDASVLRIRFPSPTHISNTTSFVTAPPLRTVFNPPCAVDGSTADASGMTIHGQGAVAGSLYGSTAMVVVSLNSVRSTDFLVNVYITCRFSNRPSMRRRGVSAVILVLTHRPLNISIIACAACVSLVLFQEQSLKSMA